MGSDSSTKAQVLAVQIQCPAIGFQKGVEQFAGTELGRIIYERDSRHVHNKVLLRMRGFDPLGTFCGGLGFPGTGDDCGHPYYIGVSIHEDPTRKI